MNPLTVLEYGCDCDLVSDEEPRDANNHAAGCNAEWEELEASARTCHPLRPVTCAWCGTRTMTVRSGVGDDATQGAACAVLVYEHEGGWFAEGFYGSSHFDMSLYRFVANLPTARSEPVCDACIQRRIDAGDLVHVKEVDAGGWAGIFAEHQAEVKSWIATLPTRRVEGHEANVISDPRVGARQRLEAVEAALRELGEQPELTSIQVAKVEALEADRSALLEMLHSMREIH